MRDPIDVAVELHDRAEECRRLGEYRHAQAFCRQSIRLLSRYSGKDHPDVANVLNTLGHIQQQLGDYRSAEQSQRRAAGIIDAIPANEADPDLQRVRVQAWTGLANTLRMQGKYKEAEPLFRKALQHAKEREDVCSILNNLGVLYKYTRKFDKAEAVYRRALALAEKVYGSEHTETATIYHNLGGLEHARGRYAEGEPYARRSVEIRSKALGPNHPETLADVAALASLLEGQGKYDEAEHIYNDVLSAFERIYGPKHYEIAVNLNNLAAVYCAQKRYDEARRTFERALSIKKQVLGARHPDIAITVNNLAVLAKAREAICASPTL